MRDGETNGHVRQREWGDALTVAVNQQAAGGRYRRRQVRMRRARTETQDRPRPLEFDENGFPIAQRTPSFFTRVARLLGQS
jgi:hypothetical protein